MDDRTARGEPPLLTPNPHHAEPRPPLCWDVWGAGRHSGGITDELGRAKDGLFAALRDMPGEAEGVVRYAVVNGGGILAYDRPVIRIVRDESGGYLMDEPDADWTSPADRPDPPPAA